MTRMYIYVLPENIMTADILQKRDGNIISYPEYKANTETTLLNIVDDYVECFNDTYLDWHIITQSPLVILRIQRHILDGSLHPSEVSIVFPNKSDGKIDYPSTSYDYYARPDGHWNSNYFRYRKLHPAALDQARRILQIRKVKMSKTEPKKPAATSGSCYH